MSVKLSKNDGQHTGRRKNELVKCHALSRHAEASVLGNRERPGQELEPLELNWCHNETIRHETRQALKVERRGQLSGGRDELGVGHRVLLVQLVYLDGKKISLVDATRLSKGTLAD
jgi:hypothetical protein